VKSAGYVPGFPLEMWKIQHLAYQFIRTTTCCVISSDSSPATYLPALNPCCRRNKSENGSPLTPLSPYSVAIASPCFFFFKIQSRYNSTAMLIKIRTTLYGENFSINE